MKWVEATCLVVLTAAFVYLLGEGGLLVRDARRDLDANSQELHATILDAHRTILVAGGAITNIERGTRQFQTQQSQVARSTLAAMSTLNASLSQLNTLESTATSLLDSQGKSLTQLEGTASKSIETATSSVAKFQEPALASLTNLSLATASLNSDILQLQPAIQNANDATKNLDAVSADAKAVSAHYSQQILHPVRTAMDKVKTAAKVAGAFIRGYLFFW